MSYIDCIGPEDLIHGFPWSNALNLHKVIVHPAFFIIISSLASQVTSYHFRTINRLHRLHLYFMLDFLEP
jgi:hypothetical protein